MALLAEFGDDALLVMAGGLSLGALLNMRMVRPEAVIDINGLSGLDTIEVVGNRSPDRCACTTSGCACVADLQGGVTSLNRRSGSCWPLPDTQPRHALWLRSACGPQRGDRALPGTLWEMLS